MSDREETYLAEDTFLKQYQYVLDEMQAGDSWRLFRIMAEFVDGFDLLSRQEPMVSVFGSARATESDYYYPIAMKLGAKLAKSGIAVITGGGPGIMEAANRGAFEAGGKSIGIGIDLPLEQPVNRYTNQGVTLRHFFVRKVMLIKYSQAFVIFPGGYGTLDELFEALNLMRTRMILPFPVILVGSEDWKGMMGWLRKNVLARGYIDDDDYGAVHITDDLDEVVAICQKSIVESTKSQWITKGRR
ncbi:MAG: TIGR00730 family Rossman fold protein [Candidatus Nitrospinota bacterium M3_3B_026]